LESLSNFKGVKRRQEILFEAEDLTILTDFAHHPTAVSATLVSLKRRFPDREVIMCHEARSNTACRKIHETDYAMSFDHSDSVFLGPVYRADRYPVSERIDMSEIAKRLGKKASAYGTNEELLLALKAHLGESGKKVVIFLSNGSFDGIPQQLAESLRVN
jgi:UDP-N-acetylmuramate: L-alanyl-gamma-D-glutamyl-meso-diaminopimelate ligase